MKDVDSAGMILAKERAKLPGSLKFSPEMEANLDQYAILTNGPAEARFRAMREKHGSAFAFHGSPLHCWYSIMRHGLRNLSHTGLMTTGAACGSGVYLAENMCVSGGYCRGAASLGYAHFPDQVQVLAVVEYLKDHPSTKCHNVAGGGQNKIITTAEECVMLRYLLVLHGSMLFP